MWWAEIELQVKSIVFMPLTKACFTFLVSFVSKKKGNVWLRTLKCVEHWSWVVTAVLVFFFKEFIS